VFSIIMPVWNRSGVVETAIRSVLAQTSDEYELLIIDDGSDDDLEKTVQPYLSEKVIYHRISHGGAGAARNFGIARAQYPWIAYLDSDNAWRPGFLETMGRSVGRSNGKHHSAYCIAQAFGERRGNGEYEKLWQVGGPFNFSNLARANYIDLNTFVHSRSCVEESGLFDETLDCLIDWDFILRVTSKHQPLFVPEVLVDYHFNAAADTITRNAKPRRARRTVRRKLHQARRSVSWWHDAIPYRTDPVPEEKYDNWLRMAKGDIDTIRYESPGYPYQLQVEPTTKCNLSCSLCPIGRGVLGRPSKHMTLGEFKGIVDDMEKWLLFLILWDWGEPLLNPELPDMIRYATDRDIRTVTSTNGHFLGDEAYMEAILMSGLSTLIVAIDSEHGDKYQVYRRGGNLDKALSGLKALVDLKKRLGSDTLINMRMVVMRQNQHELPRLRSMARQLGADVFTAKTLNPSSGLESLDSELVPDRLDYRRYKYKPGTFERVRVDANCRRIWQMSNIFSNGDIVPCCYDYDSTLKIGNIADQPLSEIWNGPAYRAMRERVLSEKDSIPHCRVCVMNFKLAREDWFVDQTHFTGSLRTRARIMHRRLTQPVRPLARKIRGRFRRPALQQ